MKSQPIPQLQGRPRSLAAEALVLGLIKSSIGDNPNIQIQISNMAQDRAGYDFTLYDSSSYIHIDVTTSNFDKTLIQKLQRPEITTFLVPFRPSRSLASEHVEKVQEIFGFYYHSTPAENGLINTLTAQEKLQALMEVNVYMTQALVFSGSISELAQEKMEDFYYWMRERGGFSLYEEVL